MYCLEENVSHQELKIEYAKLFNTNKELLDSMYYASFVQGGILPHERHLKRVFSEYFVLYQPQKVIGGDLYWVAQKDDWKFFAVGDCTGHGISGALLSVLGLSFLNYIVLGKEYFSPGMILEELDKKWIETFQQGVELGYSNDWMEIGLCAFNEKTRELQYSGAFSKLFYIHDDKINCIEGNRYPIGGWQLELNRKFDVHSAILPKNAMLYLFSDGYKDQFSNSGNKRFGSKNFIRLLSGVHSLSADLQKEEIEKVHVDWKGKEEQTDDICVMGVRL